MIEWAQTGTHRSDYSGTPLIKKLGIKKGDLIKVINEPNNYFALLGKPKGINLAGHRESNLDVIHVFCQQRSELEAQLPKLKQQIKPAGMIWVSWPKRSSKVPTDLNENLIREIALRVGLVDVKVAAIDEIWSGLKLIYRLKDR